MKKVLLTVLIIMMFSGCSTEVIPTVMPEATADIEATVDARVADELETAVSKTPTSIIQITPTQTPEPTPTSAPNPAQVGAAKAVAESSEYIKGDSFTYSLEKITGSLNHSPDGTWWGSNQSKIVRYEDTVFTYVIQNDNDPATESLMTLYKKEGEGPWEQGASVPCSVPGNILIDSKGGLHTLVFDPVDILANDSLGSLEHYYFPQAGNGDIDNFTHETVIPWTGGNETVNIRIGASIGRDDTIVLAFGLDANTSEHLYYKEALDPEWKHLIAGENLGHDFYYPYPLVSDFGYAILAIQDDYVEIDGQIHNPYHIAAYFQGNEHGWSNEYLLDNTQSSQALTHSEWQTVDISDLYMDSNGGIHVVLQDRVAKKWLHYRKTYADSDWTVTTLDAVREKGINWIRLIEIEENIYYIMASWRQVELMDGNAENIIKLDLEPLTEEGVEGIYLYVASPRTGTSANSEFVDILLLNGSSDAYPNGPNYYLKIGKDYILQKLPYTPQSEVLPTPEPTPTPTSAPTPESPISSTSLFKPSLDERYEVSSEEAVIYGTGQTLDGDQIELLLDLTVPDTGTEGPRPLLIHIHGGGFERGSRWTQWDAAKRGWVTASIDYRLAGDEPLPGPRVQKLFDAVGGESSSAVNRSFVASIEDTLVALDYLLSRADELNIDTDRIVLKGESAGAFTALALAYCADEFEFSGPTIAAVIDFSGGISTMCGEGAAIDPGEAAVFVVHGTAESSFNRALSIVDGATAAGITYEFHPLEGAEHNWLLGMLGQTTSDGRKIYDLMYEFLNHVLYGE